MNDQDSKPHGLAPVNLPPKAVDLPPLPSMSGETNGEMGEQGGSNTKGIAIIATWTGVVYIPFALLNARPGHGPLSIALNARFGCDLTSAGAYVVCALTELTLCMLLYVMGALVTRSKARFGVLSLATGVLLGIVLFFVSVFLLTAVC